MPEEDKDKKEEEDKVVLKVDMHCEACKASVRKSLRDVPGLENIEINMKEQKVTVKGKVDARKVFDRVRKKSGRRTELLFPQLKKDVEVKKKEEPKKEEAPEITVELKVKMHCGGCAKEVTRSLEKMNGVSRVRVDMDAEKVIVIGRNIDPSKISQQVVKKTGKHVQIVPPPPPPPPKKEEPTEEKKEETPAATEEKTEEKPAEEKKEEKPAEEEKKEETPAEEKKEETPAEEKKEEQPAEEKKEEKPAEEKAEEKKEEATEEKKEESAEKEAKTEAAESEQQPDADDDGKADEKRFEYTPMRSIPEYVYPPQLFSDENPNACAIM